MILMDNSRSRLKLTHSYEYAHLLEQIYSLHADLFEAKRRQATADADRDSCLLYSFFLKPD